MKQGDTSEVMTKIWKTALVCFPEMSSKPNERHRNYSLPVSSMTAEIAYNLISELLVQ